MARTKTPSNIHEITGAYKKNPQRRNNKEPAPKKGIGKAPHSQHVDWRKCWDEIVNIICPGVLGDSDRIWLERAAKLLAESRIGEPIWTPKKETLLQTIADLKRLCLMIEAEFPAARSFVRPGFDEQ